MRKSTRSNFSGSFQGLFLHKHKVAIIRRPSKLMYNLTLLNLYNDKAALLRRQATEVHTIPGTDNQLWSFPHLTGSLHCTPKWQLCQWLQIYHPKSIAFYIHLGISDTLASSCVAIGPDCIDIDTIIPNIPILTPDKSDGRKTCMHFNGDTFSG